jgi:hypothetical protein
MDAYDYLLTFFENLDYFDPNIPTITDFDLKNAAMAIIGKGIENGTRPNTMAPDAKTEYNNARVLMPWKVKSPMNSTHTGGQGLWACKAYVPELHGLTDDPVWPEDPAIKAAMINALPTFVAREPLNAPIGVHSRVKVKFDNPHDMPYGNGVLLEVMDSQPDWLPQWAENIPSLKSLYEGASNVISFVSQYLPGSQAQASYPAVTHTGPPDEDYALIIGDSQIAGYFGRAVEQKLKEKYAKVKRLGKGGSRASHWVGADDHYGDLLGTKLAPALKASQPSLIFVSLGDNGNTGAPDLLKFLRASAPSAKIIWSGPGKLARSLNSTAMEHLQGSKFNKSQQTRIDRNKELTGIIQGPNVVFLDGYDNWPSSLVTQQALADGAGYVCEEDCDGIHYTPGAAAAYANAISGQLLADL